MAAPEEREGTIKSVSEDLTEGTLNDHESGEDREFRNPARVDVNVTDEVIYVRVKTENGEDVDIVQEKKG